jgi:hypothetical protein
VEGGWGEGEIKSMKKKKEKRDGERYFTGLSVVATEKNGSPVSGGEEEVIGMK